MRAPTAILFLVVTTAFAATSCAAFPSLETPEYNVVHVETGFEIRHYVKSVWITATSDDVSFQRATANGFHRLFQYIEGGNLNWTRVPMTAPIVTRIVPSAGPFCTSAFAVQFYVPSCFQKTPPTPLPELNLSVERTDDIYVAVRTFSGYAQDGNIAKEASRLAESLKETSWATANDDASGSSYAIAQYDAPFKFLSRTNEVWVKVEYDGEKKYLGLKSAA